MSEFRLILEADSIERRPRGPAVGIVYVELEGKAFPEKGWSDFALVFLGDYLKAVLKLRTRAASRVSFFDGPYALTFRRSGKLVKISALDRGHSVGEASLPYADLLAHSMQVLLSYVENEQAVSAS